MLGTKTLFMAFCALSEAKGMDINMKNLWGMPIISAILFLFGSWIFFDMGQRAFIMYAGIYLILGISVMLISRIIHRKVQM